MKIIINNMVTQLLFAKEEYYKGDPIMSDEEFDGLEDQLKQLDPDNDYFNFGLIFFFYFYSFKSNRF